MLFNVYGKVEISDANISAAVSVQLWDKDLLADDFLGESIIDDDGKFTILASLADAGESTPELYVKIFSAGKLKFTSQAVKVSGLLKRNKATGFIEQSSYDLGIFSI
jgi:hypothetical protein